MPHHPVSLPSPSRHPWFRAAVLAVAAAVPASAAAAVEWHADLATAHAAARISRRPVLAVFVASWGAGASSFETTCLGSPESEAVLATCFEPVRVDIDEHAALTRSLGITHVPTACVLAADDTALARFEMAGTPTAFVTAAILAAQRASAAEYGETAAVAEDPAAAPREDRVTAATAAVFGSANDPAPAASRPPRGSMARVTAKVRELSAFATGDTRPATNATPVTLAQAARPVMEPRRDYTPLAWPAEPAVAPPTAPAPPAIEPAATALTPASVSPWLDAPATRSAPAPTAAAATAPAAAPAAPPAAASQIAAPLPPTTRAEPQPAPQTPGWLAALQKPFALPGKAAAEPPIAAPALPRNPFAGVVPPLQQAAPEQPAAAEAQGSMPLGLEGYCPVSLVDRGAWVEGRAQWGARHRGRTYLFAGPDEQRTFLADPDRYAPALSGDDPVLALDRGSATPGQRRYGVTYQSRMYLFATPETRSAFAADPARYTGRIALAERPGAPGTRSY